LIASRVREARIGAKVSTSYGHRIPDRGAWSGRWGAATEESKWRWKCASRTDSVGCSGWGSGGNLLSTVSVALNGYGGRW
jgi:hypothetical protein